MKVLFLSSEVAPFSKSGGLADVAAALPAALRDAGHEVVTVTPLHRQVSVRTHGLERREDLGEHTTAFGGGRWEWALWEHEETSTFFVDCPDLFDRLTLYTDAEDEPLRWMLYSHAALDVCGALDWMPDVIHCNDWQTGMVPILLRSVRRRDPYVGGRPTVLSIHNLAYQGTFDARVVPALGLEGNEHLLHVDHLFRGYVGFLESGLVWADVISTVSPTYAREIQTPEGGAGLDPILRRRSGDVVGILNGIDDTVWNPRTDPHLAATYDEAGLERKEDSKRALLDRVGLPHRPGVPTVVMVSRLVDQKGIDIMPGPLDHFLATWDLRLVVLGSGERRYEDFFHSLARRHPGKAAFVPGYDEPLSHLMEGGGDIFLMPSLFEPCGLNQMYSLAYGTLPVVRRVGGLADTVEHVDPASGVGTGFVFDHYTEDGLGWALGQALTLHIDRRSWRIAQRNGMAIDNSWRHRTADYLALYERASSRA